VEFILEADNPGFRPRRRAGVRDRLRSNPEAEMRKWKSAGSLAALLFAALAILPATAADLTSESIEALRQRISEGEAAAVDAEARRRLQALEDLRRAGRPAHPYDWSGFVAAGNWH
jgi:hypothetical protein